MINKSGQTRHLSSLISMRFQIEPQQKKNVITIAGQGKYVEVAKRKPDSAEKPETQTQRYQEHNNATGSTSKPHTQP